MSSSSLCLNSWRPMLIIIIISSTINRVIGAKFVGDNIQGASKIVPRWPHEYERPPLMRLRVVEAHLLVRGRLIPIALERRVLSLSFVCFPRTEQRGGAGFPAVKITVLVF